MPNEKSLSARTFKHLRRITRQAGMHLADDQVHDMGQRLLAICAVIAKPDEAAKPDFDLTREEMAALEVVRKARDSARISARRMSRSLGYASSRSGHLLLHRLIDKGFLVKRRGRIELEGGAESSG